MLVLVSLWQAPAQRLEIPVQDCSHFGNLTSFAAKWQKPKEVKRWAGQRQPLASRLPLASRCPPRSTPRTKLRTKPGTRMTPGDPQKMKSESKPDQSVNSDDEADNASAK